MQRLLEKNYNNRFWITLFTLMIFTLLIVGVGIALFQHATMPQEWKEILLLILGAFIGSYNRVIDFWFNNAEQDKEIMFRADAEDGILVGGDGGDGGDGGYSPCRCECVDCVRGGEHNHHHQEDEHTLEP